MKVDRQQLLNDIGITKPENELRVGEWVSISQNKKLTEEFIRNFNVNLCWRSICRHQTLSESFIEEFCNEVYWLTISQFQTLSEDFIRNHQNDVGWGNISEEQKLSEEFIEEFQDKVYWKGISSFQTLSDRFLIDFKNKIDWNIYFYYHQASFSIIKKFITKTSYLNINELNHSTLNDAQKSEINKMLKLKYSFINQKAN
jgi:hypothetical protein